MTAATVKLLLNLPDDDDTFFLAENIVVQASAEKLGLAKSQRMITMVGMCTGSDHGE